MISKIVILGSGNVSNNFVSAINNTNIKVVQIYNRHIESAKSLSKIVNAEAIDNLTNINPDADAYFFMLSDTGILETAEQIKINKGILVHIAGSISMNIFKGKSENYGVFYPFQTFSKEIPINFNTAPICIESSNSYTYNSLRNFAEHLGCKTYDIDEDKRKSLHMAGVFACNFMNHCVFLGEKILEDAGIDKELINPLLKQSFHKVFELGAEKAQTGPAKRMDSVIINDHLEKIKDNKQLYDVYKILTNSIYTSYNATK